MGQKVHPIGMRVGIIRDWDAKWYAEKEYADYLHEDLAIRKFVQKELADAAVSTIEIERAVNNWSNVLLSVVHKNKQSNVQCVLELKESKLKYQVV